MVNLTTISDRHRHFLIIDYGVVPTVLNFFINGLICWAVFQSAETMSLWGLSGIGIDLLVTAFLLPFLTCVIASAIISRQVLSGKVPALPREQQPTSPWIRRSAFLRGLFLGTFGIIFAAFPVVWVLDLGLVEPLSVSSFVVFKASWAALLAMVVTPLIGWWALASASYKHSSL